jgi:hypothetical protein
MCPHQHRSAKPSRTAARRDHQAGWLYGHHPVLAALANPDRRVEQLLATKDVADRYAKEFTGRNPQVLSREELAQRPAGGAVHQSRRCWSRRSRSRCWRSCTLEQLKEAGCWLHGLNERGDPAIDTLDLKAAPASCSAPRAKVCAG